MAQFNFGRNWRNFLSVLNEERIREAERALSTMVKSDFKDRTFIDVGSGSGLMSLAARRLGARVHSFDCNPESVLCTQALKDRFFRDDPAWQVEQGDALDPGYIAGLGHHDIVYSWGVLHHTGDMWKALANVDQLVADNGTLFIAIYNDQGWPSRAWLAIKRLYNRSPKFIKNAMAMAVLVRFWVRSVVFDTLRFADPLRSWRRYYQNRGMSPWYDAVDWVGGYPFEVAKPEQIFDFYRDRGYELRQLTTCAGGVGCNQFVFRRSDRIA